MWRFCWFAMEFAYLALAEQSNSVFSLLFIIFTSSIGYELNNINYSLKSIIISVLKISNYIFLKFSIPVNI